MTESAELIILRHRRALAQQALFKLRLLSHQVKQRKENLRDLLDDLDLALNVPMDLRTDVPPAETASDNTAGAVTAEPAKEQA